VHLDALAELALEDLGDLEGVDDIASRTDDGTERSGLAAADELADGGEVRRSDERLGRPGLSALSPPSVEDSRVDTPCSTSPPVSGPWA
jgi:hypothetical protein